ncbi:MAG: hypothetical protein E7574_01565 [Ruminococcaceae bacterium]|nr:hypothetical protein [Oscillospiraceae bacterium]
MEHFMLQALTNEELAVWFLYLQGASVALLGLLVILAIVFLTKYSASKNEANNCSYGENITLERMPEYTNNAGSVIENKQEIIAAVCAAVAEENGTNISAIRVISFRKL